MNNKQLTINHKRFGFTLIELLVAIGITAVLSAIATGIFIDITRAYNKAQILSQLERNGNTALSAITNEIRNANNVSAISNGVRATNDSGTIDFTFVAPSDAPAPGTNGYIARNGSPMTDNNWKSGINVTNATFTVIDADPLAVRIIATFSQSAGAPSRIDYQASVPLQTTVTLRY